MVWKGGVGGTWLAARTNFFPVFLEPVQETNFVLECFVSLIIVLAVKKVLISGHEINFFFSRSHLAPKFSKEVAKSKKLGAI